MSEVIECPECGWTRWIILQKPSGLYMACGQCGHTQPLEQLVDLE